MSCRCKDRIRSIEFICNIDVLICENFNSNSDYIDINIVLNADFVIRQDLKKSVILLRTRV